MLIGNSPKLARDEFAIPGEKRFCAGRLIHIEGFPIGIARTAGDIVKLQVGIGWDKHGTVRAAEDRC